MRVAVWWLLAAVFAAVPAHAQDAMTPDDPLAGFTRGTAFLRSPDNSFVLMPHGRLQLDVFASPKISSGSPTNSVVLRRDRIELAGWVGPWLFFQIGADFVVPVPGLADPVAQSFLNATDNFISFAPLGNAVVWQVGQFNAPFLLENVTSDKYFDFIERSITTRVVGAPTNKEIGVMVMGLPYQRLLHYSLGIFNGDGQNFRNVDDHFDVIGRGWVAPFALLPVDGIRAIHLGGSAWFGRRGSTTGPLSAQTTQGGLKFMDTRWNVPGTTPTATELHQRGDLMQVAVELNVPLWHRLGFRMESLLKRQFLDESDITKASSGTLTSLGAAEVRAWSTYVQAWVWLVGSDALLPDPTVAMPSRLGTYDPVGPQHGLCLLARAEYIREQVTGDQTTNPARGLTSVTSAEAGVNYWYSRRFRFSANYILTVLDGNTRSLASARKVNGDHQDVQEMVFRVAVAL